MTDSELQFEVTDQVHDQMGTRISNQIWLQLHHEVRCYMSSGVQFKIMLRMKNIVERQIERQVGDLVYAQLT
jgi:hypothetical protein